MSRDRIAKIASILFTVALLAVAVWLIRKELQQYPPGQVWQSFQAIPNQAIWIAVGFTGLNYLMFTGYDLLAIRFIRRTLSFGKTALVATTSYALSNSLGFELFTGGAVRYRLYSDWGFSRGDIAKIIAFCNFSFWIGLFAVGGVLFVVEPLAMPDLLKLPFESVHPLGWIFLAITIGYLLWSAFGTRPLRIRDRPLPHIPLSVSTGQVIVTALDWVFASATLYILLDHHAEISYAGFFGVYLLAMLGAIISNVPGGLGVFETILMVMLSPQTESHAVLGSLLAYRGVYYLLPLLLSLIALGIYGVRRSLVTPVE
jgi:uncharacterized membrane protein YbhN (UPF0104 family)